MPRNLFPIYFKEDDGLDIGGTPEDNEDFSGGEEDLANAIRGLLNEDSEDDNEEDSEDEDEYEDESEDEDDEYEDEDEDDYEDEDEDEDVRVNPEEDEDEDDEEDDEDAPKQTQSKEKNAEFAAKRRQAELDRRVQEELDKRMAELPEFKLAKSLSERFGKPVEEIMAEMDEAALVEDAKTQQVPVEVLRKQRETEKRADDLEKQINQLKFENWQTKIKADAKALRTEYKMLSKEDMDAATNYILNVARNVNIPLEEAVYAVHGKKIVQALAKSKVQDDLATQSGRKKKTPLSPNNGKAKAEPTLTSEEAYIAQQFGMTGDEYNKFRQ